MKVNYKIKLFSFFLGCVLSFAFLGLVSLTSPINVLAASTPTIAINRSSVTINTAQILTVVMPRGGQQGTLHILKDNQETNTTAFTADSSGNYSDSFEATDTGNWSAYITIPSAPNVHYSPVFWTVPGNADQPAQPSASEPSPAQDPTPAGTSPICNSTTAGTLGNQGDTCTNSGFTYDDSSQTCSCPANSTESLGTLGSLCDNAQLGACNQGFNCVNSVCTAPGSPSGGAAGGGGTTPVPVAKPTAANGSIGNCNGDPNLTPQNGVCLPATTNCSTGICGSSSLTDLLVNAIKVLLGVAGVIAVLVLVIGGFWYITSGGNEEQSEKGKKAITNAIIGLVVVMLAYAIVTIISATLTRGP